MTRGELLVERITKITKSALGEDLNNMLGIEVDKDFNEAILQASIKAAKVGMKFADEHPRWISVEDELPKGRFAIITNGDDVLVGKYNFEKGLWGVRNKTMFAYTFSLLIGKSPTGCRCHNHPLVRKNRTTARKEARNEHQRQH